MVMPSDPRPSYVQFEVRSVEDREQTIKRGHWVGKDIIFAIITPQGSKDRIERVAEDWFRSLRQQVDEQRFPRKWYDQYRAAYEAYLKDEEPPLDGTPIRNWPVISPSQYKLLRDLRILCVEDLAVANEETLSRIGPGGRALKDKAKSWLDSAKGIGMQVEEAERLRIDNENLRGQVEELLFKNQELAGQLQSINPVPTYVVDDDITIR